MGTMRRFAILFAAALLVMAQSPTPTPIRPAPKSPYVPRAEPSADGRVFLAPNFQRFQGATRCEQVGRILSCDNGYKGRL